jgi:hypothetical protein
MGVSLMFLAQNETWSSLNYRYASQARDAAESGVNSAANYLMFTYAAPGTVADPLSNYNTLASPVQYPATSTSGSDTVLSANNNVSSNYPVAAVQTAFNTNGVDKGSLTIGGATVNYTTYARLINMQQITPYLTTTPLTIMAWRITADGRISGVRSATEEVTAMLEQQIVPAFGYAAFATSTGCGALQFGGGGTTNSYDSGAGLVGGVPVTSAVDGNVGTNGNLDTNGNQTTINGTLSTPRAGTGTCNANNVTAWTDRNGTVTGGLVELPQTVAYPTPAAPNPAPSTTNVTLNNGNCTGVVTNCTGNNGSYTLTGGAVNASGGCTGTPTTFDNISLGGGATLHMGAGCYNMNSLTLNGNSTVVIDSGPVIINIAGTNVVGPVVDLSGGSVTNTTGFDPSSFQMIYAGTSNLKLVGGAQAAGLVYAPNAPYSFSGGADWYGSVVGSQLTDMGGTNIHYDRLLKDKFYTVGPFMLNSFTWNKS